MYDLKKDAPDFIKEYKAQDRQTNQRDPFQYVRQRNSFWSTTGSALTGLFSGYVVLQLVKGILGIAFLIALLKVCCN